jgi:alkylation response protein AidB-like acyl-CoA dehydrogenase
LGLSIPEEYGGLGLGCLDTALSLEAFGYGCPDAGLVFACCAHLLACAMPIVEMGSDEQKRRHLPALASGSSIAANAITEEAAGSDVYALQTIAAREDDVYQINGVKSYVTNGPVADLLIVYAVTNPKHGYWGNSVFLVDAKSPGVTVGKPFVKIGLTSSQTSTVYFDKCEVPAEDLLAREGQGSTVFERSMRWERACLFASWLGLMQRQLELCVDYASSRSQFGKTIGTNQGISFRIADMKLRLESARLLLYKACWQLDAGQSSAADIALSKLAVSEGAIQSSLDAIQIHGGFGVMREGGIETMLRDMVPGTIYSGTSEMQRQIIAKELGL